MENKQVIFNENIQATHTNLSISNDYKRNTKIYIARDVIIYCNANFNWFNKFMLKLIFGWVVKSIK